MRRSCGRGWRKRAWLCTRSPKYNPIERRFFPPVSRACQGLLFDSLETVVRLMRKASTTTGLTTTVNVIRRVSQTGRQVAAAFKTALPLVFDARLPKWNYRAIPQPTPFIRQ